MSSAEKHPAVPPIRPPQRPSLIKPPSRPTPLPVTPVVAAPPVVVPEPPPPPPGPHPISPPTEPRQYRAIGLVYGYYQPESIEGFNRGVLALEGDLTISAVLLGRATSVVKNYVDLSRPHLWVVYPRTRQNENGVDDLHLQIVGVWEPETLGGPGESPEDAPKSVALEVNPQHNYFSIRGEVIKYEPELHLIQVRILQVNKKDASTPKSFQITLHGDLAGAKTLGYFWDLEVERKEKALVVVNSRLVGIVPPKKKTERGSGGRPSRGRSGERASRPALNKEKPRPRPTAPVRSNPL